MDIEICNRLSDVPNKMITIQLLRASCPKCHHAVEFVLSEEDKQYKPEAEHLKRQVDTLMERNHHLENVIGHLEGLLSLKMH